MKVKIIMKNMYESIGDFEDKINKVLSIYNTEKIIYIKYKINDSNHYAMIMIK